MVDNEIDDLTSYVDYYLRSMSNKRRQGHTAGIAMAKMITVKGLVQGVGFRPFVYRLAIRFGLSGWVENRSDGVLIVINEDGSTADSFIDALHAGAPAAADIESVTTAGIQIDNIDGFSIRESRHIDNEITEVSPDIAVCEECLSDMVNQPHRVDYPLVNCTHCGPRYTIIRGLPYDRPLTAMAPFIMCEKCRQEYLDINNRRFHAQPVSCNNCGPAYSLVHQGEVMPFRSVGEQLKFVSDTIIKGESVAIKGVGGYHIICDALNPEAVIRLRMRKIRDGKPFAVMFRNLDTLAGYALISDAERELLTSWRRPVVLLQTHGELPPAINSGLETIGAILPYMPVHYMLFNIMNRPAIVFTSGNISDDPVEIDDEEAFHRLDLITSTFLTYNREIINRADDSVVRMISGEPSIIRRSRGYVPKPLNIGLAADGIFAAGAELKSTFCIGKGNQAILSQHIGDLKNHTTYRFYVETYKRFSELFRFTPRLAVTDMHPDYLSTRFAHSLGVPVEVVQHHHAHIASCMAEHRLDEPVIGLSFDGTGLGDDGHIWGSEFFVADLAGFERKAHFGYIALPGGDKAVEEPWRIALSLLYQACETNALQMARMHMPLINENLLEAVHEALEKDINITLSSGMGRLFDGVAALLGVCVKPTFEAEGPMRLESIADKNEKGSYIAERTDNFSIKLLINNILEDICRGTSPAVISARFHNTVVQHAVDMASGLCRDHSISKVILSGGSFQNRILAEKIKCGLEKHNFTIFMQSKVPCNDGGISPGQLAVAAKRRSNLCV